MGITSLGYIAFLLIVLLIYYIMPGKVRWIVLLAGSIAYSVLAGDCILIVYPVVSVFFAWICTNKMEKIRLAKGEDEDKNKNSRDCKRLLVIALLVNVGILAILKYLNLGIFTFNACASLFSKDYQALSPLHWMSPVGLSFYTMSVLSYIFDVYYEIGRAEKNYFRLLLFGLYFPLLISGPIIRYKDTEKELFEVHRLNYDNLTYGALRIVWGFFKSLVISERLAMCVAQVFGEYRSYSGLYIILGMCCFTLQLYTNFSGSMDIIIGVSQMFGVMLPENFRQPFFSETIQEFWQRWHITLGTWLKDYILYPVLRTDYFMALPKKWKDKLGKKKAKQYTTFLALIILWSISGLWHGGAWKYIWGTGLLQCLYIIFSEVTEPFWNRFNDRCHINTKSGIVRVLRKIRTFILITIGFMFFNASSLRTGFGMLTRVFAFDGMMGSESLGLAFRDWIVLAVSLVILWCVSFYQKKGSVRTKLFGMNIVVRWSVIIGLIMFVVIFGNYGPGYSAAEFIYQGF